MTSLQLNDTLLRLAPVQEGTSASPRVSRYLVIHDGDETFTAYIGKKLVTQASVTGYGRTSKMKWVIDYPPAEDIHLSEWDTRTQAFKTLRNWMRDRTQ